MLSVEYIQKTLSIKKILEMISGKYSRKWLVYGQEQEPYGIIYVIINVINGKVYIGQTTKNFKKYWEGHKKDSGKGVRKYLYNAIRRYGIESFIVWRIDVADGQKELDSKEIFWIAFSDALNHEKGYNIAPGGKGGGSGKKNEEIKRKMRNAQRKRKERDGYVNSPETRKKIKETLNKPEVKKRRGKSQQKRFLKKDKNGKAVNHPQYGKERPKQTEKLKKLYSEKDKYGRSIYHPSYKGKPIRKIKKYFCSKCGWYHYSSMGRVFECHLGYKSEKKKKNKDLEQIWEKIEEYSD